ncbi:beta-galactosidase [Candidatus Oleimmundimicrobium sp.]|uniref:beta-galactosidase n=1 Tax=Candidatus Oleimmundimicrobium sp. TaxID=3060597 RepID=UPI00271A2A7F|nr:beta-galactosidase [Candidatus Oleimmundimicrobium sp.]MDO8886831.1 beta-galactosidase [Candidatus Oleimmundimicrobium sp.]
MNKLTNKLTIFIIILILVIIGGIGAYFVFQKPSSLQSPIPPKQSLQQSVTSSLFGTMVAYGINDAAMSTPGILDAISQKGWTEFRKDDLAYQNFLSNLKKLIQDHTKLMKATGFSLDREIVGYFTWNIIEPQKGQFDWELTDLYVQAASNAGVKISAVIQPFAGWDQKNTRLEKEALDFAYYDYKASPPKDIAEYQNFLTKMVERYKDKVAVWEIGNEPENPGDGYQNNPEGYFDLVKITSETIKKADPKAKVTNGGAMPIVGMRESDSFKAYWTKFFALGGGQYLDYFNVHYNIERSPDVKLDPDIFEKNLMAFNNLMDKNGGRKPLYITEFGIYSGSPSSQPFGQPAQGQPPIGGSTPSENQEQPSGQPIQGQAIGQNIQPNKEQALRNLSENDQATLYFKYSILAFANGADLVFIDLIGPDNNMVGSSMAFNTDDQPRLFLTALKMIDSKISGFSKVEKIAGGQYKFTVGSKTIYVLWSGTLPNEISGQVRVADMKGQEWLMDAAGIKLNADQPVFIELQDSN